MLTKQQALQVATEAYACLISPETRVHARDLRRGQYVSIFIRFHAITFWSREVWASQTDTKTEFDAK